MEYSEVIIFTNSLVSDFTRVTGDINPIYIDKNDAKDTIFKQKIVHGMLQVSSFSKIIGTNLPSIGTIDLSLNIKSSTPVYLNKEYMVVDVDIEESHLSLETKVYDNTIETVCIDGQALVLKKH